MERAHRFHSSVSYKDEFDFDDVKQTIANIWASCLNCAASEIEDCASFIDLGGHSLVAYQAAQLINDRLAVTIRVSDLIGFSTLHDIVDLVQAQRVSGDRQAENPVPTPATVTHELSFSQRGQLHMVRLFETTRPFALIEGRRFENIPVYDRLAAAITRLVDETDAFWLAIDDDNGAFVQTLQTRADWNIHFEDVSRETDPAAAARQAALAVADHETDLYRAPSFRIAVFQLAAEKYEIFFIVSHLFFDGWSVELLFEALQGMLRETSSERHGVPPRFVSAIELEHAYLDSDAGAASARFWRDVLAAPPEGALVRYTQNTSAPSLRGATLSRILTAAATSDIRAAAHRTGCSVYNVVLSALFTVLQKASGRSDLVIGTPAANRELLGSSASEALGCFANLLPIRVNVDEEESMAELYRTVQETVGAAVAHQAYPYERMIGESVNKRGNALSPIFDVVLSYWSNASGSTDHPEPAAARRSLHLPFSKYPLEVIVQEDPDQLVLTARYATDLIDRHTAEAVLGAITHILSKTAETLDTPVARAPLMPDSEIRRLAARHDRTSATWPTQETLVSLFDSQVLNQPDAVAVSYEDINWTYAEVGRRADLIAADLMAHGSEKGDRVAILMTRGPEMIAAMMGVLRCGCAYVPIDLEHPQKRQEYILSDSGCRFVIADGDAAAGEGYTLSPVAEAVSPKGSAAPAGKPDPDDLAYIIYTSGTTGQPKGVMIDHENVVRLLYAENGPFDYSPDDVWSMFHSHCFDVSVFEIFGALSSGGRLVIISNLVMRDPRVFRDLLVRERVTILRQTPTAFYNLLLEEKVRADADLSVRQVLFAGEALAPARIQSWAEKYPACRLCNLYGTTETTVDVTYHEITAENIAADEGEIGSPLPTLSLHLVDRSLQPVPDGFVGEIIVGGAGVARGYSNKPELTAERFIDDPFASGQRAYRTGDLAKYTADGRLVYIGRNDRQVQVRGHRVEPEEVASVIRGAPGIEEAMVHPIPDRDGRATLVAYWIGPDVSGDDLRKHLQSRLPYYMTPAHFIRIEQFPTTINGKVDVSRLPEPKRGATSVSERVAPRTEREAHYLKIFASVLGASDFGVTDDFFDIGGDSLSAVKAAALSDRAFRVMDLYNHPTVAALAAHVADEKSLLVDLLDTDTARASQNLIVAVPFAGGSPADFLPVAQALCRLDPDWRFLGVSPPGLGGGRSKRPVSDLQMLARDLVNEIEQVQPAPQRIFVLGYCVGVALALAVTTEMQRRGLPLAGTVMSAIFPPTFDASNPRFDYWADTSDAELRQSLGALGLGATASDLPGSLIADFRSDVRLYRDYFFNVARHAAPLQDVQALLLFGDQDGETANHKERWAGWLRYLNVARYAVCPEGGHYFLRTDPEFVAAQLRAWGLAMQEAPEFGMVDSRKSGT